MGAFGKGISSSGEKSNCIAPLPPVAALHCCISSDEYLPVSCIKKLLSTFRGVSKNNCLLLLGRYIMGIWLVLP
jgi:hypothetical protein